MRNFPDGYAIDNTAPLDPPPGMLYLKHALGVKISNPYWHEGEKARLVDVYIETALYLTTYPYGNSIPPEEAQEAYREHTQKVITDLDRVIAELSAHRERLAASLDAKVSFKEETA